MVESAATGISKHKEATHVTVQTGTRMTLLQLLLVIQEMRLDNIGYHMNIALSWLYSHLNKEHIFISSRIIELANYLIHENLMNTSKLYDLPNQLLLSSN